MKRIFMIIFILLIMISFFYLKIKDKNIEVSEEIINNSEKEVNQIEKFAEYNCIVENNKEKILSWKIGLIKNNNVRTVSSVPVLGDIPLLRNMFRSVRNVSKKTETIVLITPHVIEDINRNTSLYMKNYKVISSQEAING